MKEANVYTNDMPISPVIRQDGEKFNIVGKFVTHSNWPNEITGDSKNIEHRKDSIFNDGSERSVLVGNVFGEENNYKIHTPKMILGGGVDIYTNTPLSLHGLYSFNRMDNKIVNFLGLTTAFSFAANKIGTSLYFSIKGIDLFGDVEYYELDSAITELNEENIIDTVFENVGIKRNLEFGYTFWLFPFESHKIATFINQGMSINGVESDNVLFDELFMGKITTNIGFKFYTKQNINVVGIAGVQLYNGFSEILFTPSIELEYEFF